MSSEEDGEVQRYSSRPGCPQESQTEEKMVEVNKQSDSNRFSSDDEELQY